MGNINVELRPHPAQQKGPNGEPLFDDIGKPVELLPDQRSVWLNGDMIGYCGTAPGTFISFILPPSKIGSALRQILVEKIAELRGGPANVVGQAPEMPQQAAEPEEDED